MAFILIENLELDKNKLDIGWVSFFSSSFVRDIIGAFLGQYLVSFDKVFIDNLMNCIGSSVKKLTLNSDKPAQSMEILGYNNPVATRTRKRKQDIENKLIESVICKEIYSEILKRIISAQKLTTFKVGNTYTLQSCETADLILKNLRKTIKNLELSCNSNYIKDLDLDKFEFTNYLVYYNTFFQNCPKTSSLAFIFSLSNLQRLLSDETKIHAVNSVKIFTLKLRTWFLNDEADLSSLKNIKKLFPSLIHVNIYDDDCCMKHPTSLSRLDQNLAFLSENKLFNTTVKVCISYNSQIPIDPGRLEGYKRDDSNPQCICYQGNIYYDFSEVEIEWKFPKRKENDSIN